MPTNLGARHTCWVLLASSLVAAIPTVASAQAVIRNGPTGAPPAGVAPQTCCDVDARVGLTLGVVSTLSIAKSFKTIAIGDPKVVDAAAQNDRSVILHPLANGSTKTSSFSTRGTSRSSPSASWSATRGSPAGSQFITRRSSAATPSSDAAVTSGASMSKSSP